MIEKHGKELPDNLNGALTIDPEFIGLNDDWRIFGTSHKDCFGHVWVNEFAAFKNNDCVFGDFNNTVWCSSEKAYQEFIKEFPLVSWNYYERMECENRGQKG